MDKINNIQFASGELKNGVYKEPYLPLIYFMQKIWVSCPHCQGPALIQSTIPIASRAVVFIDSNHEKVKVAYAKFSCNNCANHFALADNLWFGTLQVYGESVCPYCKQFGVKQKIQSESIIASAIKPKIPASVTIQATCPKCDNQYEIITANIKKISLHSSYDPIFHLPLLLQISFKKSNTLWAYNIEHLLELEKYITATLRKKNYKIDRAEYKPGHKYYDDVDESFSTNLPQWVKEAKNRNLLLKCINQLKDKLKKDML